MTAPEPDADESAAPDTPRKSRFFAHWRKLSLLGKVAALPVYFYRIFISPLTPRICRYEPTCSAYALEALARHGAFKGAWLALRRMSRCHPFESLGGGSGYDPVPEKAERAAKDKGAGDGR